MSLLTNPLLLATLAAIITLSSTQDEGQTHLTPPPVTANRLRDLSTSGGTERERRERWKGWGKGGDGPTWS